MREARGRSRRVKGFGYGDGDSDNDDNPSDDEDDNSDNGDNSSNDVPKLCSSGYKLNGWAVHMCKVLWMMFQLSCLHTRVTWYLSEDNGKL